MGPLNIQKPKQTRNAKASFHQQEQSKSYKAMMKSKNSQASQQSTQGGGVSNQENYDPNNEEVTHLAKLVPDMTHAL